MDQVGPLVEHQFPFCTPHTASGLVLDSPLGGGQHGVPVSPVCPPEQVGRDDPLHLLGDLVPAAGGRTLKKFLSQGLILQRRAELN